MKSQGVHAAMTKEMQYSSRHPKVVDFRLWQTEGFYLCSVQARSLQWIVQPTLNATFCQLAKNERTFFSQARYFYISNIFLLFLLI